MKSLKVLMIAAVFGFASVGALAQDTENEVCIPQFVTGMGADNYRWETTLMFFNQEETDVTSQWNFFGATGEPFGSTFRERLGRGEPTEVGETGQFEPTPFSGRTGRTFRFSSEGELQPGFLHIRSNGRLQTQARLHLFDADGNLVNETTIIPHPPFQTGAFFIDSTEGQLTGLAMTNIDEDEANTCRLQLFQEGEEGVVATATIELDPRNQNSQLLNEIFEENFLEDESGFVLIDCDRPVCALALQVRGVQNRQIPIVTDPVEAAPAE
jgi:hypothetical protein